MKRGFTLIELLVVLIIIGVLVALALPRYDAMVAKARWANVERICGQVANMNLVHYEETGDWFASTADILDYMTLPSIDGVVWIARGQTVDSVYQGWFYGLRPGTGHVGVWARPNGSKYRETSETGSAFPTEW